MILILIFLFLTIISIVLYVLNNNLKHSSEALGLSCAAIGFISGIVLCATSLIAILRNCTSYKLQERFAYEEKVTELTTTYNVLVNAEKNAYTYTAIQQYNADAKEFKRKIKVQQEYLADPWLNWFHCSEYNKFDSEVVSYL